MTQLGSLAPRTRFRTAFGAQGELLELGRSSATVRVERRRVKDFTTYDGQHVHFETTGEVTQWSLGTEVERA